MSLARTNVAHRPGRRLRLATVTALSLMAAAFFGASSGPAAAWWRGGYYFGGPAFYYGPPVVYPPAVVYAPPPVVYAQPPVTYTPPGAGGAAQSCVAGPYVCPLPQAFPLGSGCSCLDNGGRPIAGQAR